MSPALVLEFLRKVLAPVVAVQLAGDEARAGGLLQDDVDDVFAFEISGAAEESLHAVVVQLRPPGELDAIMDQASRQHAVLRFQFAVHRRVAAVRKRPTGESPRSLLDVLLGIVAHSEREQLHNLSREILVGMAPFTFTRLSR